MENQKNSRNIAAENTNSRWALIKRLVLIVLAASVLSTILMALELNLLEAHLYDFRMVKGLQFAADTEIALIAVDEATTQRSNELNPLPISFHNRILNHIITAKPKAIGYLTNFNRIAQIDRNGFDAPEGAKKFATIAAHASEAGIPFIIGTNFDVTGEVLPPFPLSKLPHALAVIHRDGNLFSQDKVTRRAATYLYGKPTFHLELAERMGLIQPDFRPFGNYRVEEIDAEYFFFRYHGNPSLKTSAHKVISAIDLLEGTVSPDALTGKIVLVGSINPDDPNDFLTTPYSKTAFQNPKLTVHATILDSIISNTGITRAPNWLNWLATTMVTSAVIFWVLMSTPLSGVFATLGLSLFFLLLGQILFSFTQGIWIRESQPLIGIFVGYYLVVPYRLIIEYKKRWDFQRKNEVLVQVEELKTNFMNLVTHDLKTPVARIQGLSEVLLRKANDRLLERDKETIQNIFSSTEELNRFINSILELSKIESNRHLSLNLESKDINTIIEKVADGFKAQARAKHINLILKLEPLFPIKVDFSLIVKVLNNVTDNALKYSPENSDVTIETREVDQFVEISISDQGIGMTEAESAQLFTRFYRAKNDSTSSVSGTGLGLYLSKYFIEAHQGRIDTETRPGHGTTFRIRLPLELDLSEKLSTMNFQGLRTHLHQMPIKKKENKNV